MQQQDIQARYRALRAISNRHQNDALSCVPASALIEAARQLGLTVGQTLVCDSEEEMGLVFDLVVHTARPGRSRAIDRYAKSASCAPGTEEAMMLAALQKTRFSIWRVGARHDVAGVHLTDANSGEAIWLMDEGLTNNTPPGVHFAARLSFPGPFAMTSGVVVPVDADALKEAFFSSAAFRRSAGERAFNDRGFAAAIYRGAIETGLMKQVEYRDVEMAA